MWRVWPILWALRLVVQRLGLVAWWLWSILRALRMVQA
jgi:hypothetical protein